MTSVKILTSYTAESMADNDVRYCDACIFVKDEHRALMYKNLIDTFSGGRNTDHISGNIMIVVDQNTTKIEGLRLLGRNRLPTGMKTSYPFQMQQKKYDDDRYKELLDRFGCATEKELRTLWQGCATKFCFPLLMETDEQNILSEMVMNSRKIIEDRKNAERKAATADLDKFAVKLDKWFKDKFGKNFRFEKNWSSLDWTVSAHDGLSTRTFKVVLKHYQGEPISHNTSLYVTALDSSNYVVRGTDILDEKRFKEFTDKISTAYDRWKDCLVARIKLREVFQ